MLSGNVAGDGAIAGEGVGCEEEKKGGADPMGQNWTRDTIRWVGSMPLRSQLGDQTGAGGR